MCPKAKVGIPYERVEIKLPMGLYRRLELVLTVEQTWPSRQDFVIDAVREKLDRLSEAQGQNSHRPALARK
jgi:metal-responsive CopG/Arc/MetJ family transcriptional regulator